eukprot:419984_1
MAQASDDVCNCVEKFLEACEIRSDKYKREIMSKFQYNCCETIKSISLLSKKDLQRMELKIGHVNLVYNGISDGTLDEFRVCGCASYKKYKKTCAHCDGKGTIEEAYDKVNGDKPCDKCNGTGGHYGTYWNQNCNNCFGDGRQYTYKKAWKQVTCPKCN